MHEVFMKIIWHLWLPWQPYLKKLNDISYETTEPILGWSGGAMVLGKLLVPGRPTYLE